LTDNRSNILLGGARNLKLGGNVEARDRAQRGGIFFVCEPNVDLIQLFCTLKRRSGVERSLMPWLRSSVARLPSWATVLADTY